MTLTVDSIETVLKSHVQAYIEYLQAVLTEDSAGRIIDVLQMGFTFEEAKAMPKEELAILFETWCRKHKEIDFFSPDQQARLREIIREELSFDPKEIDEVMRKYAERASMSAFDKMRR